MHYVSTASPKYKYGIVVTGENKGNLVINNELVAVHDFFWNPDSVNESASLSKGAFDINAVNFSNTEEFIEDEVNVNEIYEVEIDCEASGNGFRTGPISVYIDKVLKKFAEIMPLLLFPYRFGVRFNKFPY
ncbi:hypothetical protein Psch_01919 [Pelotomaculum schinkii]|uniref:Uncharacterized protein n=1 Tax=Pelotomaculum schinkii TaxID=78350 RepID=A0A4Y7RHQ8_9FIRM|nr:hypothetical protein Psch_01919 [Pelotomaculum schinkii]